MQQILYGASLRDYVYGELICAPLVKATKEKLSVVLVQEPSIAAMRPLVSVPVILVRHNGKSKDDSPRPVNLSAHTNFQGELSFAKTVLTPIMQSHDLIEPFERLKLALNEVHRTGVGELLLNLHLAVRLPVRERAHHHGDDGCRDAFARRVDLV